MGNKLISNINTLLNSPNLFIKLFITLDYWLNKSKQKVYFNKKILIKKF